MSRPRRTRSESGLLTGTTSHLPWLKVGLSLRKTRTSSAITRREPSTLESSTRRQGEQSIGEIVRFLHFLSDCLEPEEMRGQVEFF